MLESASILNCILGGIFLLGVVFSYFILYSCILKIFVEHPTVLQKGILFGVSCFIWWWVVCLSVIILLFLWVLDDRNSVRRKDD